MMGNVLGFLSVGLNLAILVLAVKGGVILGGFQKSYEFLSRSQDEQAKTLKEQAELLVRATTQLENVERTQSQHTAILTEHAKLIVQAATELNGLTRRVDRLDRLEEQQR